MSFKSNSISSEKKNFYRELKQEIENNKKGGFFKRTITSDLDIKNKINIVPIKEHLNIDTSIINRSVKKESIENKIVKAIQDFFTRKNKIEIQYLMSMGYTRLEAKKITTEINQSTTYTKDIEKLIKDYPSKQQKEKGYSSKSQYENDFTASVAALKKLGYTNETAVEDNVSHAQEVSTDRNHFLEIIADTPSSQSKYKTKTAQKKDFKEATTLLSQLSYNRNLIESTVSTLQSKSTPEEFSESIDHLKKNIPFKDKLVKMIMMKGYSKKESLNYFLELAFQTFAKLSVSIDNLPNKSSSEDMPTINTVERAKLLNILELSENATKREIVVAYKGLAKKYHPDKNKTEGAREMFNKILNAYKILTST